MAKYENDFKYKVCVDARDNHLNKSELSRKYNVPVGTITTWLKKFNTNPNCFKKADISGGLSSELQHTKGKIKAFHDDCFPSAKEMSALAYSEYKKIYGEITPKDIGSDADQILINLLNIENSLFQDRKETYLKGVIPYYTKKIYETMEDCYPSLRESISILNELYLDSKKGIISDIQFIETISKYTTPIAYALSTSISQSAKARAGQALENHLKLLFSIYGIPHQEQVEESEAKTIIDFIIPSEDKAKLNAENCGAIECQTTLKDRFRITAGKGITTNMRCFLATPTGVGIFSSRDSNDITLPKVIEMVETSRLTLVVFPDVLSNIEKKIDGAISKSDAIGYKYKDRSQKEHTISINTLNNMKATIHHKIVTFTEFITRDLTHITNMWK